MILKDYSFRGEICYLIDYKSGDILYNKKETTTFEPASLTKILTALIVFDKL